MFCNHQNTKKPADCNLGPTNVKWTTYTGIGKIDRGDSVCILGGPRIQVTQPTYGSTAGFRGMTDIPSVSYSTVCLLYTSPSPRDS